MDEQAALPPDPTYAAISDDVGGAGPAEPPALAEPNDDEWDDSDDGDDGWAQDEEMAVRPLGALGNIQQLSATCFANVAACFATALFVPAPHP